MNRNEKAKKRKVNKRKKNKIIILWCFLIIAFALLCGLSLTVFFPVEEVTASGSNLYSAEQIINASSVTYGENLLRIGEKRVLASLQKSLPFVDSVKITKQLPGTLKITVADAEELYVFKIDDLYYSADDEMRVLKSYAEIPENILFVDCAAKIGGDGIQRISFDNGEVSEIIKTVAEKSHGFSLKADYLDLSDLYAVEMSFDSRFKVNFGEFVYFEEKLAHFLKMTEEPGFAEKSGKVNLSQYTPKNPKAYFVKDE